MEVTKEKVLDKAKELGLTLTDDEVEKYVKDSKLPEKELDIEKAPLSELVKMLKERNAENAERRIENKKLKEKIEEYGKQKDKEKKEALEQQGEFKKLYEEALAKVNEYEPIVTEYRDYQTTKREQYKKDFGDKWIESFDTTPLIQLEALKGKLTTPKVEPNSSNHKGDKPDGNKPLINYTSMK